MKKQLLLIAVVTAAFSHLHAQTAQQKNSTETLFLGHLIRIYPTSNNGFGYDIFCQNRLVVHQINNPFNTSPAGLANKEDALKVAKWQVIQLQTPAGQMMMRNRQTFPKEVAHQLKIAVNPQTK